jgi:nucleotide sugar dehydrogenase
MKIGLLGRGTVGKAVFDGLTHLGHDMSFYDPCYEGSKFEDIIDTDCVFICVPTNQADNGDCDTSLVDQTVASLAKHKYQGLVAIKSTVIPGTSDRLADQHGGLRICSVPEFLRAKTALADFMYNHDLLIIGSHRDEDYAMIEQIHGNLPKNVARVKPVESEIVKYFNNVHHAMQVTFANVTYELCQKLGADYMNVYNAIIKRDCINPAYLMANQNMRGYGGHCLPKDTSAWNNLIKQQGLEFGLIQSVINDNEKFIK